MRRDLTRGSVPAVLLTFSLPYLISSFLQTFYGLADLFIIGMFNGAASTTAVSVGSQLMHMVTLVIIGLAMGSTVKISHAVGSGHPEEAGRVIGSTVMLFLAAAAAATVVLFFSADGIVGILQTPAEAVEQTRRYVLVCFIGIPFITAYNVIACIFRGLGDSRTPMYFVALAGVVNIVLDLVLVGTFGMAARGAAIATITSQLISVLAALMVLKRRGLGVPVSRKDFRFDRRIIPDMLGIGIPTAAQDGFIQVAFLVVTAIANQRGLVPAASVGIVEKVISFLFLVPSAMLASVSAVAAQNAGAGLHRRGRQVLQYAMTFTVVFGFAAAAVIQLIAPQVVGLFTSDGEVVRMGTQYLRAYVWDCAAAGCHFCFSGYFCAYGRAYFSFLHNVVSIVCVRIPGAYLASVLYPDTLFPMGAVVPIGSLLSDIICIVIFLLCRKNWYEDSSKEADQERDDGKNSRKTG